MDCANSLPGLTSFVFAGAVITYMFTVNIKAIDKPVAQMSAGDACLRAVSIFCLIRVSKKGGASTLFTWSSISEGSY